MALKFLFDRKKMYIYPWYVADLTATKAIKRIIRVLVKSEKGNVPAIKSADLSIAILKINLSSICLASCKKTKNITIAKIHLYFFAKLK